MHSCQDDVKNSIKSYKIMLYYVMNQPEIIVTKCIMLHRIKSTLTNRLHGMVVEKVLIDFFFSPANFVAVKICIYVFKKRVNGQAWNFMQKFVTHFC
jgi:hypothetical protein